MEQRTIAIKNGCLVCQVRGGRVELSLEVRPDRPGLYRAVLTGPRGRRDLGLLLPEGGCLRLRQTLSSAELEKSGCWPVTGAEGVLVHPFPGGTGPDLPTGWRRCPDPSALLRGDPALAGRAGETGGWIIRRGADGAFSLAAPWASDRPFPLIPVFCFAQVREMAGRRWVVYRFTGGGTPSLPPP